METTTAVTSGGRLQGVRTHGDSDLADAAAFRALASPVRLGILRELATRPETCACDFTELFALRQPTISQHLRVLREAGLVRTRRRGTQICYSLEPAPLTRLERLLARLRAEQPSLERGTAVSPFTWPTPCRMDPAGLR